MTGSGKFHLQQISNLTGEILHALIRTALASFRRQSRTVIHLTTFVRTRRDLKVAPTGIRANPGLVWFTMVDPAMRRRIEQAHTTLRVESTDVFDPLIATLTQVMGETPSHRPGMRQRTNTDYFDRIAALDFAISHNDGTHGRGPDPGLDSSLVSGR